MISTSSPARSTRAAAALRDQVDALGACPWSKTISRGIGGVDERADLRRARLRTARWRARSAGATPRWMLALSCAIVVVDRVEHRRGFCVVSRCRDRRAACRGSARRGSGNPRGPAARRTTRGDASRRRRVDGVMRRHSSATSCRRAARTAPPRARPAAARPSTRSRMSPAKAWISMSRASRQVEAARVQVEDRVLVELADRRAVRALHVVGEDLELRLGVDLRVVGQQQRSGWSASRRSSARPGGR